MVNEIAIDRLNQSLRPNSRRPSFINDVSYVNDVSDKLDDGSVNSKNFLISVEPLGVPLDVSLGCMPRYSSVTSLSTLAEKKKPRSERRHNMPSRSLNLSDRTGDKSILSETGIDELNPSQRRRYTTPQKRTPSALSKAANILSNSLKTPSNDYPESTRQRRKENGASNTNSSGMTSYDFLEKDKKIDQGSILPNTKWWYGFFVFSMISLIACIVTLWAPYPIGARMPADMVAQTPWSDGCKDNLDSCICTRETICSDDVLSMILLTISRCSGMFTTEVVDYQMIFCSQSPRYLQHGSTIHYTCVCSSANVITSITICRRYVHHKSI